MSRFHDAAQALFDVFWGRTGRAGARAGMFSATAAQMIALNAVSSMLSSSWMSMARRVLPSRLELNRPDDDANKAYASNELLHKYDVEYG